MCTCCDVNFVCYLSIRVHPQIKAYIMSVVGVIKVNVSEEEKISSWRGEKPFNREHE